MTTNNHLFLLPTENVGSAVIQTQKSFKLLGFLPPQRRTLVVETNKTETLEIETPKLLWTFLIRIIDSYVAIRGIRLVNWRHHREVAAVLGQDVLSELQDVIQGLPFDLFNVDSEGGVCFGPNKIYNLREANNLFWNTPFTLDFWAGKAHHKTGGCGSKQHQCQIFKSGQRCPFAEHHHVATEPCFCSCCNHECFCPRINPLKQTCLCCTRDGRSCPCVCQCEILKEFKESYLVEFWKKIDRFQNGEAEASLYQQSIFRLKDLQENGGDISLCPVPADAIFISFESGRDYCEIGFAKQKEGGWEIKIIKQREGQTSKRLDETRELANSEVSVISSNYHQGYRRET